jgi:peptide/nickel transport system permease protein
MAVTPFLRSLLLIPLALLFLHFLGFAYGSVVGPMQAGSQPLYFREYTSGPLLPSYGAYLAQAARLDFGVLPDNTAAPLGGVITSAALNSFGLLAISLGLSVVLGLLLGTLAVHDQPPRVAGWLAVGATMGLATPTFFLGTLLITGVILLLIWGPVDMPTPPLYGFGWDAHLLLPLLVLVLRPTAQIAQMTAGSMVDELTKQYVIAARSFGYPEQRIRRRHVLRNALAPIIAMIAGSARLLVGELIVVEWLFDWPGLGKLTAQALIPSLVTSTVDSPYYLNPPLIAALTLVIGAFFLTTGALAGWLIRRADPRLRV